ncbi:MAG: LPXTG cell wall anchor domain-containing protein [Bifidobacteriaceae bacterium]|jgi:LPXTG-motif cell wall-anchored protein|nr:LPXTG cell wall anchor domain-containing protein [Bifidobacteriaceae bacterium]
MTSTRFGRGRLARDLAIFGAAGALAAGLALVGGAAPASAAIACDGAACVVSGAGNEITSQWDLQPGDSLVVEAGAELTITESGGLSNSSGGTVQIDAGATVTVEGSLSIYGAESSAAGASAAGVAAGTIAVVGDAAVQLAGVDNTGSINVRATGGAILWDSNNSGQIGVDGGSVHMTNGVNSGAVTVDGGGYLILSATRNEASGRITVSEGSEMTVARNLTNHGVINLGGDLALIGSLDEEDPGQFINAGSIVNSGPAALTLWRASMLNQGDISGDLTVRTDRASRLYNAGTVGGAWAYSALGGDGAFAPLPNQAAAGEFGLLNLVRATAPEGCTAEAAAPDRADWRILPVGGGPYVALGETATLTTECAGREFKGWTVTNATPASGAAAQLSVTASGAGVVGAVAEWAGGGASSSPSPSPTASAAGKPILPETGVTARTWAFGFGSVALIGLGAALVRRRATARG